MLVNLVFIKIKPETRALFLEATRKNILASRAEPLVVQFDLLEEKTEPNCFILIEAFKNEEGPLKHKETPHYKTWKNTVEGFMAEPRQTKSCYAVEMKG